MFQVNGTLLVQFFASVSSNFEGFRLNAHEELLEASKRN